MKVLKNGNRKKFKETCEECKSDLEYTIGDIIIDDEDIMNFIYCPVCNNKIYVG